MKHALLFTSLFVFLVAPAQAQNLKIAVVDMEKALTKYYKTTQEVNAINQLGNEKIRNIDERKAAYKKMTSDMVELDKAVRAVELSDQKRKDARTKLDLLARDRAAKANEINDAERKAATELMTARKQMESRLIAEINAVVKSVAQGKSIDMVYDKSFLPKASKAIVYVSDRVTDITDDVIRKLNASQGG